jgi:hypothetical protein
MLRFDSALISRVICAVLPINGQLAPGRLQALIRRAGALQGVRLEPDSDQAVIRSVPMRATFTVDAAVLPFDPAELLKQ